MAEITKERPEVDDADAQFPPMDVSSELIGRTNRLREAVKRAGGTRPVAERSGVPFGTLSGYLLGREMKASPMMAVARACEVSLDWLAYGQGPEGPAKTDPAPPKLREVVFRAGDALFEKLDMELLGRSADVAVAVLHRSTPTPPHRELGRVIALFYDTPGLIELTLAGIEQEDLLASESK